MFAPEELRCGSPLCPCFPPPSPRTDGTRRVPCPRTDWTRRVPCPRTNRTLISPNAPPSPECPPLAPALRSTGGEALSLFQPAILRNAQACGCGCVWPWTDLSRFDRLREEARTLRSELDTRPELYCTASNLSNSSSEPSPASQEHEGGVRGGFRPRGRAAPPGSHPQRAIHLRRGRLMPAPLHARCHHERRGRAPPRRGLPRRVRPQPALDSRRRALCGDPRAGAAATPPPRARNRGACAWAVRAE